MEEWKTYKIKDICLVNTDQYSAKEGWQTILYLDTGNITENHIGDIQFFSLPSDELPSRARRKVKHNDIIFSTVRPNQRHYGILNHPADNLLVSTGFTVLTAKPGIADPFFVYYYLTQPELIDYLQGVAEQSVSAYPSLKSSDIEEIEIALPPIAEQKRLSSVLRSLDSKIELNIRINHNLEEQARIQFEAWCAKCVESKLIRELSSNILDYTPNNHKKVILLNSSDVTEGRFESLPFVDNQNLKGQFKKRFMKGDILYSEIRPRNHHFAICYFDADEYIASTRLMVIRKNEKEISSDALLYQYLLMPSVLEEFTSKTESRSGTFPQGNYDDLSSSEVPYSSDNLQIGKALDAIYGVIWANMEENKRLASIRDSLLPQLMSGLITC